MSLQTERDVPLAPLTTLELGGPARVLVRVRSVDELRTAQDLARSGGLPLLVLGGGSNLVVADEGFPGVVVRLETDAVTVADAGADAVVEADAGVTWDALVAQTVGRNLVGIECLSGIPGSVGATPVQNVGAYGQEVADTITWVRAFDRVDGRVHSLDPAACAFGYRDSQFRRDPERFVVLSVAFRLRRGTVAVRSLKYPELARRFAGRDTVSAADIRAEVLALRRSKSMVLDAHDPNRRSAGSFFTNPILSAAAYETVATKAVASGAVRSLEEIVRYPVAGDRMKLSAAWLIERSGFNRGYRVGAFGLSSQHTLAIVHHGGGSARELLGFARGIASGVHNCFGVTLTPEPVFVGLTW